MNPFARNIFGRHVWENWNFGFSFTGLDGEVCTKCYGYMTETNKEATTLLDNGTRHVYYICEKCHLQTIAPASTQYLEERPTLMLERTPQEYHIEPQESEARPAIKEKYRYLLK